MKKKAVVLTLVALSVLTWGGAYGANITISDEDGTGSGWYGTQEDQEVSPGCVTGQAWDLEAFDLTGSTLTMVSGYSFVSGVPGYSVRAGDIFIDVDGDAQYGTGAHKPTNYNPSQVVSDLFGYDYVIDMDFQAGTYNVINLNAPGLPVELLTTVNEQINDASNPWRYRSGGTLVTSGVIGYQSGQTDAQVDTALGYDVIATGGSHDLASVDLGWLGTDTAFTVHFTEECGNDNLMGATVPEPMSIVLLGLGLGGLVFRKTRKAV